MSSPLSQRSLKKNLPLRLSIRYPKLPPLLQQRKTQTPFRRRPQLPLSLKKLKRNRQSPQLRTIRIPRQSLRKISSFPTHSLSRLKRRWN